MEPIGEQRRFLYVSIASYLRTDKHLVIVAGQAVQHYASKWPKASGTLKAIFHLNGFSYVHQ